MDSYIFYDKNAVSGDGNHTFEDEAKIYQKELFDKYGDDHVVHLVPVSSSYELKKYWNSEDNMQDKIDEVYFILHGSIANKIGYMYFTDGSKIFAKAPDYIDYKTSITVAQLNKKYIHRLTFSSCNTANPDSYNIVYAFMQRMNMFEVTGWDGGTVFDYKIFGGGKLKAGAPGKGNQSTWYKNVQKNSNGLPVRKRYGKRKFYQKNGIWTEYTSYRDNIYEGDK